MIDSRQPVTWKRTLMHNCWLLPLFFNNLPGTLFNIDIDSSCLVPKKKIQNNNLLHIYIYF